MGLAEGAVARQEASLVSDDFDIDQLKVHKITPRKKAGRLHLPVAGAPTVAPEDDIDEATGGDGERHEVVEAAALEEQVVEVLKSVYDPEIPLNVYDLGLIYGVRVNDDGDVDIEMTLTAPACPVAGQIVRDVAQKTGALAGVRKSHVQLVWDPPWTKARMSDEALLELGLL